MHERCRLCSMGIMKRSLPLLVCVLLLAPAICVALIVMSFNFLGDGLRDALDPRLRDR